MFVPQYGSCWLTQPEQEEAIEVGLGAELFKWDNNRGLKLKSGGMTDIYFNMREMRNTPTAIDFFADVYANALRRLRVDRLIEVPEAVSPLAGVISVKTGLPIVTVREEAKEGRVVSGKLIGTLRYGDRVAIVDDVITDGASKVAAILAARAAGAKVAALVVTVDRQQGWKKKLDAAGLGDVPVWPAMTLHDVRKRLIAKGLMQRCDPKIEARNPIIFALDGKNWEEVLPLADQFRTKGVILKVNDLLWGVGFERLLPDLSVYGRVMADIKGHDIPNTITNIVARMKHCPPWALTVHATGGEAMLKAAVQTAAGTGTKILAVTVLTSIDQTTSEEVYTRLPLDEVMVLAEIANRAGVDGFVCSPQEVSHLATIYPGKLFVTPGVRSEGKDKGDQKRVDTPKGAMASGATHLVIGRQIMHAENPLAEHDRVMKDELGIGN